MIQSTSTTQRLEADGDLLARFVEGDQAAFEQVVDRHSAMVLAVCQRVTRRRHDAEDAAQAAFIALAKKARQLRGRRSVAPWLHRTARYASLNLVRSEASRKNREEVRAMQAAYERPPDPDTAESQEALAALDEAIAHLSDKLRAAVILHYYEGKSVEETAQQLGCGRSAVLVRLHRARQLLRKRMGKKGFAFSAAGLAAVLVQSTAAEAMTVSAKATTLAAAQAVSTGGLAAAQGVVSAQVLAASQAVVGTMLWTQVAVTAAVVAGLTVATVGVGVGVSMINASPSSQDAPPAEVASQQGSQSGQAGPAETRAHLQLRVDGEVVRSLITLRLTGQPEVILPKGDGSAEVTGGGLGLHLSGTAHRQVVVDHQIRPGSRLELDFQCRRPGAIHGLILETAEPPSGADAWTAPPMIRDHAVQLHGSSRWGHRVGTYQARGGWQRMTVPLDRIAPGARLQGVTFVTLDGPRSGAHSGFANVRIE